MTRSRVALLVVTLAVIGVALWIRFGTWWKIDACLDSGGAWNYARELCRR